MTPMLQIVGAVLLLAGFVAAQLGVLHDSALPYLAINVVGAGALALVALREEEWGFLLLEGSWAAFSTAGVLRTVRGAGAPVGARGPAPTHHTQRTAPQPQGQRECQRLRPRPRRSQFRVPLPRTAQLAGDELSAPSRLIHLVRDSYAAAQGRQWLQPHVLWWTFTFLREHGVVPDWNTLASPELARTVTALGLPPGHTTVEPAAQTAMNFGLWWSLFTDLTELAYRPWGLRCWPRRGQRLPDAAGLQQRAAHLGLKPWMSSATVEEISAIACALADIHDRDRRRPDSDEFMVRVLLPELLLAELYWLHVPSGRPRTGTRAQVEVVLLRRYDTAVTKWSQRRYLTALDHMYLRAGDILHHLSSQPNQSVDPQLRPILDLYTQLQLDQNHAAHPMPPPPPTVDPHPVPTASTRGAR